MTRPTRRPKGDRFFTAIAIAALLVTLAFWAVVLYVAAHFIGKFW